MNSMPQRRKDKVKIRIVKKGIAPTEIDFTCPICQNRIQFSVYPDTLDIKDIYCDASDEGDHKIKCGQCDSVIQWIPNLPENPSRRK